MTRVLVGGVGYRWMGDASFGLTVIDRLSRERWPNDVELADLGYGALYVTQDLADRKHLLSRLVLVAAVARGREPGRIYCRRWEPVALDDADVQARVREAGAGVIDLDHLLVIAQRFDALPGEVLCVELEPVDTSGGDGLSDIAARRVPEACTMVRSLASATLHEGDLASPVLSTWP